MGARSVLQRAARERDPLSRWALAVRERRGYHRACVAVAAKNARVLWAVLAKARPRSRTVRRLHSSEDLQPHCANYRQNRSDRRSWNLMNA